MHEKTDNEKKLVSRGRLFCFPESVAWSGTIVDGHHRYAIAKIHREIPFEVREMDFPNEFAALSWACANQLGRRNLTSEQKNYLIGKEYENEKLAHGGDRRSKQQCAVESEISSHQNDDLKPSKTVRTKDVVAERHGVSSASVERAGQYSKGVDMVSEVVPEAKDKILSGEIKVSKSTLIEASKAEPELREDIAKSIASGDEQTAREIMGKPAKKSKKPAPIEEPAVEASEPVKQDDVIPEGMN